MCSYVALSPFSSSPPPPCSFPPFLPSVHTSLSHLSISPSRPSSSFPPFFLLPLQVTRVDDPVASLDLTEDADEASGNQCPPPTQARVGAENASGGASNRNGGRVETGPAGAAKGRGEERVETELVERVKEVLAADVAKFRAWLQEECDGEVCARTHMCARTRTYALIRAHDNRTRLPRLVCVSARAGPPFQNTRLCMYSCARAHSLWFRV